MIYTKQTNIGHYLGISENFDTAIRFLQSNSLESLTLGRNDVNGDNVYINRFDYTTIAQSEALFEAHEQYADIHMVLSGNELIGVSQIDSLIENSRNPEEDFIGLKGETEVIFLMQKGDILIVLPEDAHMVKLQNETPCEVQKAVFKVRILP